MGQNYRVIETMEDPKLLKAIFKNAFGSEIQR